MSEKWLVEPHLHMANASIVEVSICSLSNQTKLALKRTHNSIIFVDGPQFAARVVFLDHDEESHDASFKHRSSTKTEVSRRHGCW